MEVAFHRGAPVARQAGEAWVASVINVIGVMSPHRGASTDYARLDTVGDPRNHGDVSDGRSLFVIGNVVPA